MSFKSFKGLSIGRSGLWITLGPLKYFSDIGQSTIQVPTGFETDLASIPRVFLPFIGKNGNHRRSAILHDYLYHCNGNVFTNKGIKNYSRATCDKIFLEAMQSEGVSWWKRKAMYRGVRLGGWTRFKGAK